MKSSDYKVLASAALNLQRTVGVIDRSRILNQAALLNKELRSAMSIGLAATKAAGEVMRSNSLAMELGTQIQTTSIPTLAMTKAAEEIIRSSNMAMEFGAQIQATSVPTLAMTKAAEEIMHSNNMAMEFGAQIRSASIPTLVLNKVAMDVSRIDHFIMDLSTQIQIASVPALALDRIVMNVMRFDTIWTDVGVREAPHGPLTIEVLHDPSQQADQVLLTRLYALSPDLAEMLEGAWYALMSLQPDSYRQAAHSARELINWTLRLFAPDSVFSQAELRRHGHDGKPTRKMRTRFLLSRHSGDPRFVDAHSNAIEQTHNRLVAVAHAGGAEEVRVRGLLRACEGVLLVLVDAAEELNR